MSEYAKLIIGVDSRQVKDGERALDSFSQTSSAVERQAKKLGAAIGGAFALGKTISTITSFEDSILRLQATSSASVSALAKMEKQARELGATSRYSAGQAADAQNFLAMAGLKTNEILSATPSVMKFASAASLDLARSADIASNVLGGMQLPVDQLDRVMNSMVSTAQSSNTNINQLGDAFAYAAPLAVTAAISVEELAAATGVLGDAGVQGGRAGTGLVGVIRQLSNVSTDGTRALASYGLGLSDVDIKARGIAGVLETLGAANLSTADAMRIFGSESAAAALILSANVDKVKELTGANQSAAGKLDEVASILDSSVSTAFAGVTSAIEEMMLQAGDKGLSGSLKTLAVTTAGVINSFNGMLPEFVQANGLSSEYSLNIERAAFAMKSLGAVAGVLTTVRLLTVGATQAQLAFNLAARANPYVLIATSIASAAVALHQFTTAQDKAAIETKRLWDNAVDSAVAYQVAAANLTNTQNTLNNLHHKELKLQEEMQAMRDKGFKQFGWHAEQYRKKEEELLSVQTQRKELLDSKVAADKAEAARQEENSKRQEDLNKQLEEQIRKQKDLEEGGGLVTKMTEDQTKALSDLLDQSGMTTASLTAMAAAYMDGADNVRELTIAQKVEQELLKTGASARSAVTKAVEEQQDAQDKFDIAKQVADIRKQNKELEAQIGIQILNSKSVVEGEKAQAKYNVEKKLAAILTGKNADALSTESEELKKLLKEQEKYVRRQRDMEKINQLVESTATKQEKLNKELGELYRLLGEAKTPEQVTAVLRAIRDTKQELGQWADWTKSSLERVDSAFADSWRNIGDGFKGFRDNLTNGFKQMLAELAHLAITKPIVMQLGAMMGIGAGTQGFNGIWGGLLGGGEGGSGGGGGSGSGAWGGVSTAWTAYQGMQGEGMLGQLWKGFQSAGMRGAWAGISNYYGETLSGINQFAGQVYGTMTQGSGMSYAPLSYQISNSGAGSAMSTLFSYAPYILAAWQGYQNHGVKGAAVQGGLAYGGGLAGGAIGGAAAGAASGTAFGATYGSYFGPIGTAVGAILGTILGGAILGGGTKYKRTVGSAKGVYSSDEYTGLGAVESFFGGSRKFGEDFDQSLHDLNEAFASSLGGLFSMFDIQSDIAVESTGRLRRTSGRLAADFRASFEDFELVMHGQYSRKGNIEEGFKQFADDVMGRGLAQAIAASSLPDYLKELTAGMKKAEDVSSALGDLFLGFDGVNNLLETLNFSAYDLSDSGLRASDALLDLVAAMHGLEDPAAADKLAALSEMTSTYYDSFFTAEEKIEDTLKSIARAFESAEVELPDTREAYRSMVEDIDMTTEAGQQMFATLMNLSGQAATFFDIAEQKAAQVVANAMGEANSAFALVQRSIGAERSRLTAEFNAAVQAEQAAAQRAASAASAAASARVNSLNASIGVSQDLLRLMSGLDKAMSSALDRLRSTEADVVALRREQSVSMLHDALAWGRSGKLLAGFDGLDGALDVAATLDTNTFKTLEDFRREQGITSNLIADLQGINGKQLTTEEKLLEQLQKQASAAQAASSRVSGGISGISSQLQADYDAAIAGLDAELEAAQAQMDALNGIDHSILSVGVAVDRMSAAIVAAVNAQQSAATGGGEISGDTATIKRLYESILGYTADAQGVKHWTDRLGKGDTYADLVAALRWQAGQDALGKVPGFASGGFHGGGLRLVGEDGPELEVTGPSRIYNSAQTAAMLSGGGSAEEMRQLARVIAELQQTVAEQGYALRAIAKHTHQTARRVEMLERWDFDGMPEQREAI